MDIEFSIWIASKTRWAHLKKLIPMPVVALLMLVSLGMY